MNSNDRMLIELALVSTALEIEAELGGQIFLNRSPHVQNWSATIHWPKWVNRGLGDYSGQSSIHCLLSWDNNDMEGARADLEQAGNKLRNAITQLIDNADKDREKMIVALREKLAMLESEQ